MTAIDTLLSRASIGAVGEPGPDDAALKTIVDAGLRAPDHGRLRPWRVLIVRGDARARLGELLADALQRRDPNTPAPVLAKERDKPQRAPVVIAVVATIHPSHKIPEVEQLLSAGAATMNMLNAIHALGFGGVWKTGDSCYDPSVGAALGLAPTDRLVGFLYIGTPVETVAAPARPNAADFLVEWAGA
jgi:nitroreductase